MYVYVRIGWGTEPSGRGLTMRLPNDGCALHAVNGCVLTIRLGAAAVEVAIEKFRLLSGIKRNRIRHGNCFSVEVMEWRSQGM